MPDTVATEIIMLDAARQFNAERHWYEPLISPLIKHGIDTVIDAMLAELGS